MSTWRSITVGERRYAYRVGRQTTEVRLDGAVKFRVDNHVLVGVTPDVFDRGQWKRTSDGMITPSMVAAEIRDREILALDEENRKSKRARGFNNHKTQEGSGRMIKR